MADKVLKHRGYHGSIEIDLEHQRLYGKVLSVKSLITYAGDNLLELQRSFEEELDDYLADCAALGVEPEKPFSGTFQIRCSPSLHKELSYQAQLAGVTFNQFVVSVLQQR